MATQEKILEELAKATGPTPLPDLGKKLGEKVNEFSSQLKRLVKKGEIEETDAGLLISTEGRDRLYKPSQIEAKLTEYDYFRELGKSIGIPPDILNVTVEHVWKGGSWKDLNWVWKALGEMGIRSEIKGRWFHAWRSYLHQPVPSEIATEVAPEKTEKGEGKKEGAAKEKRAYIISLENLPIYVGEGLGDLDEDRAFELAKIRATRGIVQQQGQPLTPGTMAEEVTKILTAVREFSGPETKGKSWVVSEGEEGFDVLPIEEGKPVVVGGHKGGDPPTKVIYVDENGDVKELPAGSPIVIKRDVSGGSPAKQFLIDKGSGSITEVQPGQPVVIIRESAPPSSQAPMIQAVGPDGNPLIIDLSSYFKLEEHKAKIVRDTEVHDAKMDLFKGFKDLVSKATKAAGHMAEEK